MTARMGQFWAWLAACVQMQQWERDHGPAPDGMGWSGTWRPGSDGVLSFRGAELVGVPFPIPPSMRP